MKQAVIILGIALMLSACATREPVEALPGKGAALITTRDVSGGGYEYRGVVIEIRTYNDKVVFDFDRRVVIDGVFSNNISIEPGEYIFVVTCYRKEINRGYYSTDHYRSQLELVSFYDVTISEGDVIALRTRAGKNRRCSSIPMVPHGGKNYPAKRIVSSANLPSWYQQVMQERMWKSRTERTNQQIRRMMEQDIERMRQQIR